MSILTVSDAAFEVLTTSNAYDKAAKTNKFNELFLKSNLKHEFTKSPPERPSRPATPRLLPPNQMPKRRKGGSKENRTALLHAIAHIELNAIDLAWDIILRFGEEMPKEFTSDWISVANDEARHFLLLLDRLRDLDANYGDLPAHDGLWEAALETKEDITARLAIVPMVLEARGLDVTPQIIKQFKKFGDVESQKALEVIYNEEVNHVFIGNKWFNFMAQKKKEVPETLFKKLVKKHFKGILKPPFNNEARDKAGLPRAFYQDA